MNPPENRELTAEILFESFNVPGLHIAVQAVLALASSWTSSSSSSASNRFTGTVVDSGDGVTHVIPVVDGYVVGSAIKSVPIAGREVTMFIQSLIREREALSFDVSSLDIARTIKESHCYTASDVVREFHRFDENPNKHIDKLALPTGQVTTLIT